MMKRTKLVYGLLLAVWGTLVAWQVIEHDRVIESARRALINRSLDITTTLELVIRSQRRFGMVSQDRLEPALKELVKSGEVGSIALLNASGEVVASAGAPIDLEMKGMLQTGQHWDSKSVTIVNLVDLGTSVAREGETNRPPIIVLPRRDPASASREEDRPPPPDRPRPRPEMRPAETGSSNVTTSELASNSTAATVPTERREGPGRPRFGRPFWMDEKEYKALLERRGLHGLVLAVSTDTFRRTCNQDLWLRTIIGVLATVSVVGSGLAWRNLDKSADLQLRLARASQLNSHLRDMNLAAAGLAHETRNPLNIIRGLAHMISRETEASLEVRKKSREIIDETDRVTAQLNEFINYSRPREVRRVPVELAPAVSEVARTLNFDIEEKAIRLEVLADPLTIEADEQLFRQALFNLVLNAVQAVDANGEIQIRAGKSNGAEAFLEVRDNGPGVSQDQRAEIFKPYFTTHQNGTGLGLAVVQQIVQAHGWDIECLGNEPNGAIFRLSHLKLAKN